MKNSANKRKGLRNNSNYAENTVDGIPITLEDNPQQTGDINTTTRPAQNSLAQNNKKYSNSQNAIQRPDRSALFGDIIRKKGLLKKGNNTITPVKPAGDKSDSPLESLRTHQMLENKRRKDASEALNQAPNPNNNEEWPAETDTNGGAIITKKKLITRVASYTLKGDSSRKKRLSTRHTYAKTQKNKNTNNHTKQKSQKRKKHNKQKTQKNT